MKVAVIQFPGSKSELVWHNDLNDASWDVGGDSAEVTLRRNKLDFALDRLRDTYMNTLEKVLDQ